jgi:hypothetical protein
MIAAIGIRVGHYYRRTSSAAGNAEAHASPITDAVRAID